MMSRQPEEQIPQMGTLPAWRGEPERRRQGLEQRRGPHSGQVVSDNDDLLRLSSDEEDGIDEPGVLKRAAVYCSPQTDSHKERHAIYSNGITVTGGLKMHDTGFNSRAS